MKTEEINKRFCELAGIEWIDRPDTMCPCCADNLSYNADYCSDPRLVLEVMMKREDWPEFRDHSNTIDGYYIEDIFYVNLADYIRVDFILDKTGQLALLAIRWMERSDL